MDFLLFAGGDYHGDKALVGKESILRSEGHLYCIAE
jgi:hypothetical protein